MRQQREGLDVRINGRRVAKKQPFYTQQDRIHWQGGGQDRQVEEEGKSQGLKAALELEWRAENNKGFDGKCRSKQ